MSVLSNVYVSCCAFVYRPKQSLTLRSFLALTQAIDAFPSNESPEIFGLHPNADLTFRALQVRECIGTILDTAPKAGAAAGGLSREETVDKLAEDLLARMPKPFGGEEIKEKLKKLRDGPAAPLNVHLKQEIDRLNTILGLAAATLTNLRLAVAGTIALSGPLIDALDTLFDARWGTGSPERFEVL